MEVFYGILNVARSSFYASRQRPTSTRTEENHSLSCTFDPDIKPHEAAMAVHGFIEICSLRGCGSAVIAWSTAFGSTVDVVGEKRAH